MVGRVYTKTGDKGETSLFGGTRVPKYHVRLESYGTIDELNSYMGLIRDVLEDDDLKEVLLGIQLRLFSLCSDLANEKDDNRHKIPAVKEEDIVFLENKIDEYLDQLPPLKSFVLPGGHIAASYCHVARTVCRRAERNIIRLSTEAYVNELVIKYVNRLSDFLFVLSRKILKDFNKEEILWQPYL